MNKISITDFRFLPSGYGHYRVTYTLQLQEKNGVQYHQI